VEGCGNGFKMHAAPKPDYHTHSTAHLDSARPDRGRPARLQAVLEVVEGCGDGFAPHVTPELRALLLRALLHPNRFVRETCYHITAAVCRLSAGPALRGFAQEVAERLQDGLSENWSQVGPLSSLTCRASTALSELSACHCRSLLWTFFKTILCV
jgi:hypothetical protein